MEKALTTGSAGVVVAVAVVEVVGRAVDRLVAVDMVELARTSVAVNV